MMPSALGIGCSGRHVRTFGHDDQDLGAGQTAGNIQVVPDRISQITVENGVETTIVAQFSAGVIHWSRSEHMQFYDGEAWSEDQPFEDFLENGPSELAAGLSKEKLEEIARRVRGA